MEAVGHPQGAGGNFLRCALFLRQHAHCAHETSPRWSRQGRRKTEQATGGWKWGSRHFRVRRGSNRRSLVLIRARVSSRPARS